MKFLHAMIRVKSLEESMRFYQELLGLKLLRELRLDDCNLYFLGNEKGETQIELTYNDDTPQEGYKNGSAFGHFAFETKSFEEFNKKVKDLGYKYLYEPFVLGRAGSKIAFLNDPDGNEIEIIESK